MIKKRKFFLKLFVGFTILIFIFTFFTSAIFFLRNNKILQEKLENKNFQYVEQTGGKIDNKLSVAFNLINELRINEYVIKYAGGMDNYQYNILQVKRKLEKNLAAFSNLHYNLSITKNNEDIIISPRGTSSIINFFEYSGFDIETQSKIQQFFKTGTADSILAVQSIMCDESFKEIPIFTIIKKEKLENKGEIILFITFYWEYFVPSSLILEHENFAIFNTKEVFIISTPDRNSGIRTFVTVEKLNSLYDIMDKMSEKLYFEINDYSIYSINSKVLNGWSYLFITPANEIKNAFNELILYYIIVWFVIIFLGLLLSFFTAKNTYKPIKNIVDFFREHAGNYYDDKDELAFIKKTANKMQEVNKDLLNTIKNNSISLRTKFFHDISHGLLTGEDIKEIAKNLKIDIDNGEWTLCVFEFTDRKNLESIFSHDVIIKIRFQILLFFKEQLDNKVLCEIFQLDYSRDVIIMKGTDTNKIKKELNGILATIEMNFDIRLIASISKPVENIESIADSMHEAIKVLDCRLPGDNRMIIDVDDIKPEKIETYYYPIKVENNLIRYVVRGQKDTVVTILNHVFNENLKDRKLDKETLNEFIFALISTIKRILQNINKKPETFFGEGSIIYLEMKMCSDMNELEQKVRDVLEAIMNSIDEQNGIQDNSITEQMMTFVHDNYMKDISLLDIAEHFNLSIGYISKAFRKYTGENFKDYLNIYRIKKAKEIVNAEKDIKIKELAWMVGCNNTNTFIRMFKRYEGISPGQYQSEKT